MEAQSAILAAESQRGELRLPASFQVEEAEKRIIEIAVEAPVGRYLVRDHIAWIVRFTDSNKWVEVALEDDSGRVLRIERSR